MVLVTVIGLLALFSLLSMIVGGDDRRGRRFDPRNDVAFWTRYAAR